MSDNDSIDRAQLIFGDTPSNLVESLSYISFCSKTSMGFCIKIGLLSCKLNYWFLRVQNSTASGTSPSARSYVGEQMDGAIPLTRFCRDFGIQAGAESAHCHVQRDTSETYDYRAKLGEKRRRCLARRSSTSRSAKLN